MFYVTVLFIIFSTISYGLPITKTNNDDFKLHQQNPEEMGGHFEGDMIFPQGNSRGVPYRSSRQRWPNGIVPYQMTSSISDQHQLLIIDAMRQLENLTVINNTLCIQFRPKISTDKYFIIIQNSTDCSATIGYNDGYRGDRYLNLMHTSDYSCMTTGVIQHELLHTLGFFHEQARPDRDEYIFIDFSNIPLNFQSQFQKYSEQEIDTLGTEYDYGSLMHYPTHAFSINGEPTIIPTRNASAVIGQRIGLSPIDILEIQRYYSCAPLSVKRGFILLKSIVTILIVLIYI